MAEKKETKKKPEDRLGYALGGFAGQTVGKVVNKAKEVGGAINTAVRDPMEAIGKLGAAGRQAAGDAFGGAYGGIPGGPLNVPGIEGLGGGLPDLAKNLPVVKYGEFLTNFLGDNLEKGRSAVTSNYQATAPDLNRVDFANAINRDMGFNPMEAFGGANQSGATQGVYANNLAGSGARAQGSGMTLADALMARGRTTDDQQQALIGQLQAQASGQGGPGTQLAQNMLQQATNANAAQGAGLIASQRGINPALAARQAATLTANANQQAAMQGANLGLQNQLAAQQQLGGMLGQNQALNVQGAGNLYQGIGNNNVNTGAGVLNSQRTGDIQVGSNVGALANQRYATNVGGQGAQNQAINQGGLGAQEINARTASGNASTMGGLLGGVVNAGGAAAAGAAGAAHGGRIPGKAAVKGDSPKNDTVPINVSPGEIVVPRTAAGDREAAKAFIDHLFGQGGGKAKGYGKVAAAREAADKAKKKGRAA